MGAVIDAIEDGHIASHVTEGAEFTDKSECKLDNVKWPCDTIRFARISDNEKAGRRA